MLIGPLFQILFFAYLGRYSGLKNDAFFVVGNAVQSSAMSSVFAGTMAIANERQYQTLVAAAGNAGESLRDLHGPLAAGDRQRPARLGAGAL